MAKYDDIIAQAAERFKQIVEIDRNERELADDDIRFACNDEGCQWPVDLRKEREDDERPCLVNNKIPEKIDQVDGEFKQLQPSFKVRAIDSQGDVKVAEIISGLMRHIEYNSDARQAYNHAHTSTLYSGRGAWRIDIVDAEDDPFVKDIVVNRIPNVLSVYWDNYAKKPTKQDANWFFITELVDRKEFEREHKDIVDNWPDDDLWFNWRVDNSFRLAEYWWKEKIKKTYYRVERLINGMPTQMTVEQPGDLDRVIEEKQVDSVRVRWCKMVAGQIIDNKIYDWPTQDIPIIIEIGKELNIRGIYKTRGMVRHAKDPQRMYNYWSSTVTEQIALAPKAPYLVTAPMIANYQGVWNTAHKKNYPYLPFEADPNLPGGVPRREPPPMMGTAYQYEFSRQEHDIMSAMGIYAASLGDVDSKEQSGRAILARQRQGNTGSYPYTDSFNIAYTYSCKQLIRLIPHVYDTERIVRIVGDDGREDVVPINARPGIPEQQMLPDKLKAEPREGITQYLNDITVGKYDVAVTIGPSYTTQREETLGILMDLLKTAPMTAQAIMDLVASNMDIPKHSEEIVNRLRKLVPIGIRDLEPGEQPPEQPPDPKIMLEMAKLQLEKEVKDHELQIKEFAAQMKAAADLMTAESKEAGNQVSQMISISEQIRKMVEQQYSLQGQQQQAAQAQMQQAHDMEMGQRDMALKETAQQQAAQMAQQQQNQGQEG